MQSEYNNVFVVSASNDELIQVWNAEAGESSIP